MSRGALLEILKDKLMEGVRAVGPLYATVVVMQLLLVEHPSEALLKFAVGGAIALIGMIMLFAGVDLGVLQMGHYIGAELPLRRSWALIVGVAFALGFATTVAEPDVLVFSRQVEIASGGELSGRTITYLIAIGVGTFSAMALVRIVRGFSMRMLFTITFIVMLALSVLAPPEVVPLAYDGGSVTTGVLTTPVVLALALGLSSVLAGRSMTDGFGILGFASVGPIIVVLLARVLR